VLGAVHGCALAILMSASLAGDALTTLRAADERMDQHKRTARFARPSA